MIVPASIVEVLCALALSWGAAAVLKQSLKAWRAAFIGNLVAIIGVAIGIIALAVGAGPRTASNDLYHAGAGDRLASDPPCSRGTHGTEAELNRSLSGCAFS